MIDPKCLLHGNSEVKRSGKEFWLWYYPHFLVGFIVVGILVWWWLR